MPAPGCNFAKKFPYQSDAGHDQTGGLDIQMLNIHCRLHNNMSKYVLKAGTC